MKPFDTVLVALAITTLGADARGGDAAQPRSIAVYALSRGTGVPPATKEVYRKASALLRELASKHEVGRVEEKRLGLEGESRVCAELMDAAKADAIVAQLHALGAGVELMNVVEEPCRKGD